MTGTLVDDILSEIERCNKLKAAYNEIPAGASGSMMIQQDMSEEKRKHKDFKSEEEARNALISFLSWKHPKYTIIAEKINAKT